MQSKKCILRVKEGREEGAREYFGETGVVMSSGTRHLGAVLGSNTEKQKFVGDKVKDWVREINVLAKIATTEPHAAFAAFTHCLQAKWNFVSRTIPEIGSMLTDVEDAIRQKFLPSLLRREVSDDIRALLALPARFGGLGIFDPVQRPTTSFEHSTQLCEPLTALILRQADFFDPTELQEDQKLIRKQQEAMLDFQHEHAISTLSTRAPPPLQRAIAIARQKGASSWVTAIPSLEHETVLHKGDFSDALCIRYGWDILSLPETCACGQKFNIQHALDCNLGGYRTLQHNEVRDLVAECLRETRFSAVEAEPQLQPLSGESFILKSANKEEEARSDVKCVGFWKKLRQAYFDIKVVSPYARSNLNKPHKRLYRDAEQQKDRESKARINQVEQGDFTPLVFTTAGGMAPRMHLFLKRISQTMSEQQDLVNSVVSGWLRCRFSFALLRTTLICLRGTRRKKHAAHVDDITRAVRESHIDF